MIERIQAKRNEEGFTLIELLIVIIVLGILAAIVVFAVASTRKDSVASSCKTDVKSIELSAEAINTKSGSYPAHTGTNPNLWNSKNNTTADGTNLLGYSGTPNNGGLLKAWPSTGNYFLQYEGGSVNKVHVFPKTATEAADGSMATGTAVGDGSAGCDLLP